MSLAILSKPLRQLAVWSVLANGLLVSGCVTSPYESAFNFCDAEAGSCYRYCEQFADNPDDYGACHADCEAEANICFSQAYDSYRASPAYSAYYAPRPWYGSYGYWRPNYGYYYSFDYGRRYRDPYSRRYRDYRRPYDGAGRRRPPSGGSQPPASSPPPTYTPPPAQPAPSTPPPTYTPPAQPPAALPPSRRAPQKPPPSSRTREDNANREDR